MNSARTAAERPHIVRTHTLWVVSAGALFVAAFALRFIGIARAPDYDEGVYWASLRAMTEGYHLYRDVYSSQPPLFLLSAYPAYVAFGASLAAARAGMVLCSCAGLYGMFLLCKRLAGQVGAFAALALLSLNAAYFAQSQMLHAEIPAIGLAILGIALSMRTGRTSALLSGALIAAALLVKLLVVAAVVPFVVLALLRRRTTDEVLCFAGGFCGVTGFVLLIFAGELRPIAEQVFLLHTGALATYWSDRILDLRMIAGALRTPLLFAAILGSLAAGAWRTPEGKALIAWFAFTVLSLCFVSPLWDHHLVVLFPPLVALAAMGLRSDHTRSGAALARITAVLIMLALVTGSVDTGRYLEQSAASSQAYYEKQAQVIADISNMVKPHEFIITDLQSVAAYAGRSVPPQLVDTSEVRIKSSDISSGMLIAQAQHWNVRAVLIGSGRMSLPQLAGFRRWLQRHYRVAKRYGSAETLWLR